MQDVVANAATLAAAQSQRKALRTLTAISTLTGNKQIGEAREHR